LKLYSNYDGNHNCHGLDLQVIQGDDFGESRKEVVLRKNGDIGRHKADAELLFNGGSMTCYNEEVV